MKKTNRDKIIGELNKKFERVENAEIVLNKSSKLSSSSSFYSNFLTSISKYVDFVEENLFLSELNADLLKLGMNEYGNYPKTQYGFSYEGLGKLNLAFRHEEKRPLLKIKWTKSEGKILSIDKVKGIQRIYYTLLKQVENGTYNGSNPFRPELHLEIFEHVKRVHLDLLDSINEMELEMEEETQPNEVQSFKKPKLKKKNVEFDINYGDIKISSKDLSVKISNQEYEPKSPIEQNGVGALICIIEKKMKRKEPFRDREGFAMAIWEKVKSFKEIKRKLKKNNRRKFASEALCSARKILRENGSKYKIPDRSMIISLS